MDKTKQIWVTSIFEVFEKMFYIFLEQVENDGKYDFGTQISFSGPRKGQMRFFFSGNFARTMAMNMLNMDPDEINRAVVEDCLKEAVNMICGNFLRKLDTSQVFDLGLPQLIKETGAVPALSDSDLSISAAFESDGEGFFGILTFLKEDAAK